jgi:hypothetical protein
MKKITAKQFAEKMWKLINRPIRTPHKPTKSFKSKKDYKRNKKVERD